MQVSNANILKQKRDAVYCHFIPKAKYNNTVKLIANQSNLYSLCDICITSSHHIIE